MVQFSFPAQFEAELRYFEAARSQGKPWGGGQFYETAKHQLLELHPSLDALMTQSCTAALELAALALDIGPGDEVIVPSYTFVSSANAFALRGAKIVFADSSEMDLNLDLDHVETLISEKTKVIVVVHYGGVSCDMERVMRLAKAHGIYVVEDAAQAIGSTYKGRALGTLGHLGTLSFHGTKNVSCGEGGALLINVKDQEICDRARMAHEKGTDRAKFLSGQVDKYTWRTLGGSFIPSEFTMAVLSAQLESSDVIKYRRTSYFETYREALGDLGEFNVRVLPQDGPGANFHMFALVLATREQRDSLRKFLSAHQISATSHYEPLHLSPFGARYVASGDDLAVASDRSGRILRLPMWSHEGMPADLVASLVLEFFTRKAGSL